MNVSDGYYDSYTLYLSRLTVYELSKLSENRQNGNLSKDARAQRLQIK